MKKLVFLPLLFLLFLSANCASDVWYDDMDSALGRAEKAGRPILALFTKQDANPSCIRLAEVTSGSPEFTGEAEKHFVLANIDFTTMIADNDFTKAGRELVERYFIYNFPTALLLDPEGRCYAVCDYDSEDGKTWLAGLLAFTDQRENRDLLLRNAAREGEPQKRLETFVSTIDTFTEWGIIDYYPELKNEVIQLDTDNKAGLRAKYIVERSVAEIGNTYFATNGFEPGIGALENLLIEFPDGEAAQHIYYTIGILKSRRGETSEARRLLQNALNAAPQSKNGEAIRAAIRSLDANAN